MEKKMRKQNNSYSRSVSTRSKQRHQITFKTIFKRRNETIPAKQIHQTIPNRPATDHTSRNDIRPLAYSTTNHPLETQQPSDIREYVRQMGVTKADLQALPDQTRIKTLEEDARSQRSVKSQVSSYSGLGEWHRSLKVPRTIEELQQKIENLVAQSMEVLKKQRTNIGLSKWSQVRKCSSLEQDLRQIELYFTELQQQLADDEQSNEKLADLNKKIELLEKMMATSSNESQLLRIQYFNWKNQRGNTTSFSSKKLLNNANKFNQDLRVCDPRRSSDTLRTKEAVTRFNSTSQTFFKKPGKEHYLRSKPKENSYSLNRQPLQRSSYSAQFLNYGHVPTYSHKPDAASIGHASLAVKASAYQQQYRDKLGLSKPINFKELDCYQDKFRNPNISFMNNAKKPAAGSLKRGTQKENKNSGSFWAGKNRGEPSMIACMNMTTSGDFYKSEQAGQFVWHNKIQGKDEVGGKEILRSEIKDKKLMRMKDAFKTLVLQG